jgi:hypothetical protein
MGQELGDQDRVGAARQFGQAKGQDGGQVEGLEPAQDLVLAPGDLDRLFLEGDQPTLVLDEPDEVARGADRQLPEVSPAGGPRTEGQLPGQADQGRRRAPQAQVREAGRVGRRRGVRWSVGRWLSPRA